MLKLLPNKTFFCTNPTFIRDLNLFKAKKSDDFNPLILITGQVPAFKIHGIFWNCRFDLL